MAVQKFFTQEQLTVAKQQLESLPDLSPNRISRDDMLAEISTEIVMLANQKGYSAADIKSALQTVGIHFSEKVILNVIRAAKSSAPRRTRKSSGKNESSNTTGSNHNNDA